MHFWTRWKTANTVLYAGVAGFHHALGIGVNESAYTWGKARFEIRRDQYDEIHAQSPLQLLLIAAVAIAVMLKPRAARLEVRLLLVSLLTGAVLFCLVLRWQPWHTRLQLPLFVLAGTLVALPFEKPGRQWRFVS